MSNANKNRQLSYPLDAQVLKPLNFHGSTPSQKGGLYLGAGFVGDVKIEG